MSFRIVAALVIYAAIASADESGVLTVSYQWSNGSVAPKYYAIHRVTIHSNGEGEILVIRSMEIIGKTFAADAAKLRSLLDYIHVNRLDSAPQSANPASPSAAPTPGDGTCVLSFVVNTLAYSVSCKSPKVAALLGMIREIVPAATIKKLDETTAVDHVSQE